VIDIPNATWSVTVSDVETGIQYCQAKLYTDSVYQETKNATETLDSAEHEGTCSVTFAPTRGKTSYISWHICDYAENCTDLNSFATYITAVSWDMPPAGGGNAGGGGGGGGAVTDGNKVTDENEFALVPDSNEYYDDSNKTCANNTDCSKDSNCIGNKCIKKPEAVKTPMQQVEETAEAISKSNPALFVVGIVGGLIAGYFLLKFFLSKR
jgi:hypothetical protein